MRPKTLFLLLTSLLIALNLSAQNNLIKRAIKNKKRSIGIALSSRYGIYTKVKIDSIPTTPEGFKAMRDKIATDPKGGAAMFLLAMKVYVDNPELGKKFLVLTLAKDRLQKGDWYKGYEMIAYQQSLFNSQLKKYPYLPNSYIKGATPENGYKAELPFVYLFTYDKSSDYSYESSGEIKVYVNCSGASYHRPIWMKENSKGIWKAEDWGSLLTGVVPPQTKQDEEEDDEL